MEDFILELENITKEFPGVLALDNVSLRLKKNEVVGLVGENGAGKSTLMKILAGIYQPNSGKFILNGEEVRFNSYVEANKHGIGMVFQEQSLLPNLSIAENLFLGSEKKFLNYGRINKKIMDDEGRRLLKLVDFDHDPWTKTKDIDFSQRQMVEIAKVLRITEGANNFVILFDEPTSLLQDKEIEKLFGIINDLKKDHSIIFVSHRLDEVLEISDLVYILKDGKNVAVRVVDETDRAELHRLMVGRSLQGEYYKVDRQIEADDKEIVMEVDNLSSEGLFKSCSFKLHRGEILGLCGVEGSGNEALCRAIFGLVSKTGRISIDDSEIVIDSPDTAVSYGIGYVPKERLAESIIKYLSVTDNINLSNLKNIQQYGIIKSDQEKSITNKWVKRLRIKTPKITTKCYSLSGGNQQKVILSKWLATEGVKILILDHPTRGVDVGAKEEIYELIREIAQNGISIILTSDTLEELIGLSNKIYVMKDGVITKTFSATSDNKPKQEELVAYMV